MRLEQIRLTGPASRGALKRDINQTLPTFDFATFWRSTRSEEMKEGVRAFAEKRAPNWPRGGS